MAWAFGRRSPDGYVTNPTEINQICEEYQVPLKLKYGRSGFLYHGTLDGIGPGCQYSELSYGQQKLISLIVWVLHLEVDHNIKLILLDEPDAHFNPKLIESFYQIVSKGLTRHGRRVIVTTHRVDTLALAAKDRKAIYSIQKNGNEAAKIVQEKNARSAITLLSDGLLNVVQDIHYLTVEDENDAKFYSIVREKFKATNHLPENVTQLIFRPAGVTLEFTDGDLLDDVKNLCKKAPASDKPVLANLLQFMHKVKSWTLSSGCDQALRKVWIPELEAKYDELGVLVAGGFRRKYKYNDEKTGLRRIEGHSALLDHDRGEFRKFEAEGIFVLPWHSLENFLYFSIVLFFFAKQENCRYDAILSEIKKNFAEFDPQKPSDWKEAHVQAVSDSVIDAFLRSKEVKQERREIKPAGGLNLDYPIFLMTERGHKLEEDAKKKMPKKWTKHVLGSCLFSFLSKRAPAKENNHKSLFW